MHEKPRPAPSSETLVFVFSKGNKQLTLIIDDALANPLVREAFINVKTVEGRQPVPGQMTDTYSEAVESMQDTANKERREVDYTYTSNDPVMNAWLRHPEKGGSIFDFQTISDCDGFIQATTTIYPQNTE